MEAQSVDIIDIHSFGNMNDVVLSHLFWDAQLNFDSRTIEASAAWTIDNKNGADKLILDTENLTIKNVTLDKGHKTTFELMEADPVLGRALHIQIYPDTKNVVIEYETSPEASALQWLNPQQTAGKVHPFLLSQSQAIMARSWIPCMDGPGVRFTYDAKVTLDKDLMAVMSASNPTKKNDEGVYNFSMKQAIPSYLMAIAAGDIAFQGIGKNSGVYAEPSLVEAAAAEFEDIPQMITDAESLYGPYTWDRYDVIVLPPSFPFGGMENPRLTFATPTIIAGDKSLVALVAHELAHSWSGNLVTNSNWEDFWLNEGFTVYFEQRIMELLRGREYSEMLASLSYQGLLGEIAAITEDGRPGDTRLKVNLDGRHPDDTFSGIPYDKGYLFLRNVEEHVGRERFDGFLKTYFNTYAFKSMTTELFEELLEEHLIQGDEELAEKINLKGWIHTAGLPESHPIPVSSTFTELETLSDSFISSGDVSIIKDASEKWSSQEWQYFLTNLPDDLNLNLMSALDAEFNFTNSGNSEIAADWYELAIKRNYEEAFPAIEEFLIRVGRRKFLTPIYSEFAKTPGGLARAIQIYEKARPNYHSVSYNTIDKVLGLVE